MKKSTKEEKASKTKTKPKKGAPLKRNDLEAQGFLIPKDYKNHVRWRENPLYRGTFLLLLLLCVWVAISVPRWIFINQWEKANEDLQKTSLSESEWIAASLTKIRPIRNKYQEIEEILKFRRIALSPILGSIQTHIPKEISLNKIEWETNLTKTTKNMDVTGRRAPTKDPVKDTARQATLKLEIYSTPVWKEKQKTRSPAGWLANVEKDLAKQGIKVIERNIGAEVPHVIQNPLEMTKAQAQGYTINVVLKLELEGPKLQQQTAVAKRPTPQIRPQIPGGAPAPNTLTPPNAPKP